MLQTIHTILRIYITQYNIIDRYVRRYVGTYRETKIIISSFIVAISDCKGSMIEGSAFLNCGSLSHKEDVSILSWME